MTELKTENERTEIETIANVEQTTEIKMKRVQETKTEIRREMAGKEIEGIGGETTEEGMTETKTHKEGQMTDGEMM